MISTPEARARQARLIRTWRPWEKSTGPKSKRGKATVSKNRLKHGLRSDAWAALLAALREQRTQIEG